MKISTTWSRKDWINALKKAWGLADDFEEILNFGLEYGFINSTDIIHASDIYKDPNKEYDDAEVKEMIEKCNLSDLIHIILETYDASDIVDELDADENILDKFDDGDLLDHLEGTYALENHDDDVRRQYDYELREEIELDLYKQYKDNINDIKNYDIDQMRKFFCNLLDVGYYDDNGLFNGLNDLIQKMNSSIYKLNKDEKWELKK